MYFEDFKIGQIFDDLERVTFTKEELIYAGKNWDSRDIHIYEDNDYFETVISPGVYSIMVCWGKFVKAGYDKKATIAGYGIDGARWLKPMFPDVEYKISVEVYNKEIRKPGKNGLVYYKMLVKDPHGEICLEYCPIGLVKLKNSK